MIDPGFHILKWTFTKVNKKPLTELVESEIEYVLVKGRHQIGPTACTKCRRGEANAGASRCEPCKRNQYFDEGFCKLCPAGTLSSANSIGFKSCQPKKPCDKADVEFLYSKCKDGKRTVTPVWATPESDDGSSGCDARSFKASVKELPKKETVDCKPCLKG